MSRELLQGIVSRLGGRNLVLASFREPYAHAYVGDELRARKNSGGVVTALDSLLLKTRGTWVAFGLGEADKDAVNERNECTISDPEGSYVLKRVFISKQLEQSYSGGLCNSGLWPFAHQVFIRPKFVDEEWAAYVAANKLMAQSIIEVARSDDIVWVHDYHLVLAGQHVRKALPSVMLSFFWHIPWPSASVFRIFPWAHEFLEGLLAYDVLGFHTRYDAANFLNSVDSLLEARVDRAESTITYKGKTTRVMSAPVSIDYEGIRNAVKGEIAPRIPGVLAKYGVKKGAFMIGVDRMDYTKGIREKLLAFDLLLKQHEEYKGKMSLLQIASPTRLHIPEYQHAAEDAESLAEDINWEHATAKWKPVRFVTDFVEYDDILALYSASNLCVVTSLDDGMNLVCKEYVAASDDGAVVLSSFAGASLELKGALHVNPFSLSSIANAMHQGLQMDKKERVARLDQMHSELKMHDVFQWADTFLQAVETQKRRTI